MECLENEQQRRLGLLQETDHPARVLQQREQGRSGSYNYENSRRLNYATGNSICFADFAAAPTAFDASRGVQASVVMTLALSVAFLALLA